MKHPTLISQLFNSMCSLGEYLLSAFFSSISSFNFCCQSSVDSASPNPCGTYCLLLRGFPTVLCSQGLGSAYSQDISVWLHCHQAGCESGYISGQPFVKKHSRPCTWLINYLTKYMCVYVREVAFCGATQVIVLWSLVDLSFQFPHRVFRGDS